MKFSVMSPRVWRTVLVLLGTVALVSGGVLLLLYGRDRRASQPIVEEAPVSHAARLEEPKIISVEWPFPDAIEPVSGLYETVALPGKLADLEMDIKSRYGRAVQIDLIHGVPVCRPIDEAANNLDVQIALHAHEWSAWETLKHICRIINCHLIWADKFIVEPQCDLHYYYWPKSFTSQRVISISNDAFTAREGICQVISKSQIPFRYQYWHSEGVKGRVSFLQIKFVRGDKLLPSSELPTWGEGEEVRGIEMRAFFAELKEARTPLEDCGEARGQ